jgi:L-aminopeptidase/D-esterase-like protein
MNTRVAVLLSTAMVCQAAALALAPTAFAEDAAGQPGALNAITDVPGIQVGQVQSTTAPYLTGTSVVYTPTMSVASVDQRGGAPATKETDLLSPLNSNPGINAIQLGGSSMYGLSATNGIIRWLENRGEGVGLGSAGVAPIVPAADIYDLARGGDPKARTSAEWGYLAAEATAEGPVRQGVVGGGAGARSGGLKGGVGTASVYLGDGVYVGAMVVVNSAGSPVDPRDCTLLGARYGIGDEFAGLKAPSEEECHPQPADENAQNTTIAVVATNAPLEKAAAQRMSGNAHDGMARAIDPIHTLADGDTVFAVSTGSGTVLRVNDPASSRQLNAIFNAGASTLARAITKALLSAQTVGTTVSYCDTYPSACAELAHVEAWRTQGNAPDVDPASFRRATAALKQTPVPRPGHPAVSDAGHHGTSPESDGNVALTAGNGDGGDAGMLLRLAAAGLVGLAGLAVLRRRPQVLRVR